MDTHDAARPSLDPAQPDPDAALRERALAWLQQDQRYDGASDLAYSAE